MVLSEKAQGKGMNDIVSITIYIKAPHPKYLAIYPSLKNL